MLTATFAELRQAERDYPSILKQLRRIEAKPDNTTTCGITGRPITLSALTTRFTIVRPHRSHQPDSPH